MTTIISIIVLAAICIVLTILNVRNLIRLNKIENDIYFISNQVYKDDYTIYNTIASGNKFNSLLIIELLKHLKLNFKVITTRNKIVIEDEPVQTEPNSTVKGTEGKA